MLGTTYSSPGETRGHGHAPLAYNLAAIAALVLLLAVAAAYLVDSLGRSEGTVLPRLEDGDPITQNLTGRELTIPSSWFRYGEQIRDGFTDEIDLKIRFAPEGEVAPVMIDVTLLPRSRARTSSSLLDRVYLHQFGEGTLGGVPGLIGKPMRPAGGYSGESVWYDALSPDPFVAKCLGDLGATGAGQCVRTVYLPSGIAAVYTFDAGLLGFWRQFDAEMHRWLSRIGAW